MMIVKLGGSVITDKRSYRTFREDVARRLAREIYESGERVILVHGAGSFGHVLAEEYGLHRGFVDDSQTTGLVKVARDVRELDDSVLRALGEAGVDAMPIPPSASIVVDGGEVVDIRAEVFERFLDLGIVPVSHGDVVLDRESGFSILSGDRIVRDLTMHFCPERVVFCTDVDEILDGDPSDEGSALIEVVDEGVLDSLPDVSSCTDVTGSIRGKVEEMLAMSEHCGECIMINGNAPGRLLSALRGEDVIGTRCSR